MLIHYINRVQKGLELFFAKLRFRYVKRPDYYTEVEGGAWYHFPPEEPFDKSWLEKRDPDHVRMGTLYIHSLCFGEFFAGPPYFTRWDCINGITQYATKSF